MIDTVALPIEQQVNGVENMLYMQSFATSDGTYASTVTFEIGTDLNSAQVSGAEPRLSLPWRLFPQSGPGSRAWIVQKKSTAILQIITLTSPDNSFDSLYLSNYGTIKLKDEIARLPGVGNVNVFGAGQYSMRIWLDPQKMQARDLNAQDVIQALQQQSEQVTAGQLGMPPVPSSQSFQYTIDVVSRFDNPAQFANVVVKTGTTGDLTRVRDVGRVELGAQTYSQIFNLDGKQAAGLAIFQTPGRERARRGSGCVADKDPHLVQGIPARDGLFHPVRHHTVRPGCNFRGLQNACRSRHPGPDCHPDVPAGLARDAGSRDHRARDDHRRLRRDGRARLLDQSTRHCSPSCLRSVSSWAMPSSSVEGAAHKIEQGLSGHDAAIRCMNELMGPIIGITLVLMAVFLPASFLPGLTGQMYAQFALVIAAHALISAINAATLKPHAMRALAASSGAARKAQFLLSRLQRDLRPR